MEISHFERLFKKIDESLKGVFNLQYRMHPDINDVIKQFYVQDSGLECGLITPIDLGVNDTDMSNPASRYHGIEIDGLISKDNHVIWIDTNSPELLDGTSRTNYGEVEAIRDILTKFRYSDSFKQYQLFWKNPEDQQIGLISFYGKQIKLLRNLRNEFRDIPIRVSTVDRFQGMERNIIIVSMVRSNRIAADKKQKADIHRYGDLGFPEQKDLGFAQSPNRLNVALSRAKRLLIIVGNSELFRQKEIYNNVYQTIANNSNGKIIKYKA
jgi:superfamily I DNA and/or RNA helicase